MSKKAELLEAIAGKNRGLLATELDRVKILSLVEQLEDYNPTPQPLKAKELLDGNWRLLYTTSRSLLGLERFPLVQLQQIYQYIRVNQAQIYNIAEITGLPFLEGIFSVSAIFEPVSETRVNVRFQRYFLGLQRLIDYHSPEQFIRDLEIQKKITLLDFNIDPNRDQKAWLDITYLDQNLRISRGNEGNLFILSKEI